MPAIKRDETLESPPMTAWQSLARLSNYVRPYRTMVAGTFILMLVGSFLRSLPPLLIGKGINDTLDYAGLGMQYFLLLGAAYLGLHLAMAAVGYVQRILAATSGQRIVRDIRNHLFRHVQGLSLRFFDNRQTGELMSRTLSDVDMLEWGVLESSMSVANSILLFLLQLALMTYLNWRLTLIAVSVVPVIILVAVRYNSLVHDILKGLREKMADLNTVLQESISGIRVVKTFCRETHHSDRFARETQDYVGLSISFQKTMAFVSNVMVVFGSVAGAIVLAYGGWLVIHGELKIGNLTAIMMYLQSLYGPIQTLIHDNYHLQRAGVAASRVFELIDTVPEIADAPDAIPLESVAGHVQVHGVVFSYRPDAPVLKNVSIEARPGEMVALVGRSGAGKSTLISLIPRLYDVQSGAVCIDGKDVRRLRNDDLRRNIAMVMQDVFLFDGTIRDNIGYGRLNATEQEIMAAAESAHVNEFVNELPDGYHTQIGERGVKLSGGQRQRISLARAFLANAPILLLDEPTSNVDTHSERLIQEAIGRLMQNRTTFVIAHRLSTILRADKIVLLERGRIHAEGTHNHLLENSPLYAHLYRVQFEENNGQ